LEQGSGRATLLFVDDEEMSRKYFSRLFSPDYDVVVADTVAAALTCMQEQHRDIAVLVTDQRMPGPEQGTTLLQHARRQYPLITRVLSTAFAELEVAVEAVNNGEIYRFVLKPWDMQRLPTIIADAVSYHRLLTHEQDLISGKREAMMGLAASVVHEMRTPLAAIQLGAKGLVQYLPTLLAAYDWAQQQGGVEQPLSRRQRHAIGRVAGSIALEADQAMMVVESMLHSVRDNAVTRADLTCLSMAERVAEAIDRYPFQPSMRDRVRVEVMDDFNFLGHRELIVFVFYNLLRNAVYALAAADKGEIVISVSTDTDTKTGGGLVRVRDTGSGIADEHLAYIFDDYYTTREVGSGTGLGLPFCRRVLTTCDAEISVHSELGEYTEFRLKFPYFEGELCA